MFPKITGTRSFLHQLSAVGGLRFVWAGDDNSERNEDTTNNAIDQSILISNQGIAVHGIFATLLCIVHYCFIVWARLQILQNDYQLSFRYGRPAFSRFFLSSSARDELRALPGARLRSDGHPPLQLVGCIALVAVRAYRSYCIKPADEIAGRPARARFQCRAGHKWTARGLPWEYR